MKSTFLRVPGFHWNIPTTGVSLKIRKTAFCFTTQTNGPETSVFLPTGAIRQPMPTNVWKTSCIRYAGPRR